MKRVVLLLCFLASLPALATTSSEVDAGGPIADPRCATPAHLGLSPRPAAGWIVIFADETDAQAKTATLELRHRFKADAVYPFGGFYVASLTQKGLAALRCEATVSVIEQNAQSGGR